MVDWPAICKKFGWNESELCGPVAMAAGPGDRERNCCSNHPKGCKAHVQPKVNGKPFKLGEYRDELRKLGLTTQHPKMAEECQAGQKPPGQPTKVGGATVYPARNFA